MSQEKSRNHYKFPFLLAVVLHVILFIVVFANTDFTNPNKPLTLNVQAKKTDKKPIVTATTVNQADLNKAMAAVEKARADKRAKAIAAEKKLQALKAQAKREARKLAAQKRAARAAKAKAKAELDRIAKQKAAEAKRLATVKKQRALAAAKAKKEQAAREAKRKADEAKRKLAAKKKAQELALKKKREEALKKQRLENFRKQLAQDAKALSAERSHTIMTALDKYKALVTNSISNNWIKPEVNKKIYAILNVRVAKGGTVLNVTVQKSSGSTALDNSAKTAIYKASPLPVPSDPTLFNYFRNFNIRVSPSGFLAASE